MNTQALSSNVVDRCIGLLMALRVGIVGVGRIGSRFDEEPGRRVPWSHVGAYLAHPKHYELAGVVEVDRANRESFSRRCPGIPVFGNAGEMAARLKPDVVSICTPTERHLADAEAVLDAGSIKVLWCEKPLASSLDDAGHLLNAARGSGATLVVSYVRRWLPLWRRVRDIVQSGVLGTIISVRVAMPNRLLTIQSHAVDLALHLGGAARSFGASQVRALAEDGEETALVAMHFTSGAYGIVHPTGMRSELLIEAEVIGSNGRLRATEHDGRIVVEDFQPSGRFSGYRELANARTEQAETFTAFSPFAAIAADIAGACQAGTVDSLDNGAAALQVQRIIEGALHQPWTEHALP
jgi:predicted dehydrogenase